MENSSVPTEDGSIAEWDYDSILTELRDTECSLLLERFFDSNTLLHVAASLGHDQIVEAILSKQQCQQLLTATNSNGDLPLHVAANAGHLSIVQHLVNPSRPYSQELLMEKNSSGDHPLHVAANAGHLYIVQHLYKSSQEAQNSKVNVASKLLMGKNKEGNTPLHLALIKKYEQVDENLKSKYNEVATFLIGKESRVCTYRNEAHKYPHAMAFEAADNVLLDLMKLKFAQSPKSSSDSGNAKMKMRDAEQREPSISKKVPQKSSMDPELYKAVKSKNIGFIETKAQDMEQPALSDKTPDLNTILHLAAASSDNDQFVQDILKIQLCQKFVTEKNSNGDLPLHVAASAGNMQILQLLVQLSDEQFKDHHNCVPLAEKNMEENTPLHLALIKKFQVGRNSTLKDKYNKVAKFLVEKCPEVSFYPNKERKSPLYLAAEGGDEELVKHMITTNRLPYGKSIVHAAIYYLMTITNLPYGNSIVHTAIYGSYTTSNKGHLGVNIYSSGRTKKKKGIVDTVLESVPDDILTVKDDRGMTPLFYAASIGYLHGVKILLKKPTKCCAYEKDTDGNYPTHIASRKGHIEVVKKFLDERPDMIELLNEKGQNILHVAAMYGKAKVVAYMLEMQDLKVEMLINNGDENGNTPLHLASKEGHFVIVSILTSDDRVVLNSLNKEGKRALDIALEYSGESPSYLKRLTSEALKYVSGPRAPPRPINGENPQSSEVGKTLSTDKNNDRTNTLLLVATLVATVTFAAAFTIPGGYKESGGMALFLEKPMFHVFIISNALAMYSAITVVVALIWAYLGDHKLVTAAYKFSEPILGLAITMVSIAFMAGNFLVLRDLNWLAYIVLSIGSFFLFTLSIIFFPLCLPYFLPHPIIRCIFRCVLPLWIKLTDDREEE